MPDKVDVETYLKHQGRFKKMLASDHQHFQKQVDDDWLRLLDKCRP